MILPFHHSIRSCRVNNQRLAYSVLELLIALGLLGTLLAVGWSMLGSYQSAVQRGWNLSERTQTVRAVREWLERDLLQVIASEIEPTDQVGISDSLDVGTSGQAGFSQVQETDSRQTIVRTRAHFIGSSTGFTAIIRPSIDPLPFLEQILNGNDEPINFRQTNSVDSIQQLDGGTETLHRHLWPMDQVTVEYRVLSGQSRSAMVSAGSNAVTSSDASSASANRASTVPTTRSLDPGMRAPSILVRREKFDRTLLSARDQDTLLDSSEQLLTAADLYRQNDEQTGGSMVTLSESLIPGLNQILFSYFDGSQWKSSWNSSTNGRLPSAVAVSFDVSLDRNGPRRIEPATAEIDSDFDYGSSVLDEASGEAQWDGNPSQEGVMDGPGQSSRDVRIVIRLWPTTAGETGGMR